MTVWWLGCCALLLGGGAGCGSRELVTQDVGEVLRLLAGTDGGRFGPGLEAEARRYSVCLEGRVVWLRHEPTKVLGPDGLEAVRARIVETLDGFSAGYRQGLTGEHEDEEEPRRSSCYRHAAREGYRAGKRDKEIVARIKTGR